ncbi:YkgJ family cysteine cluster protein [Chloroflexota bacterium]
MEQNLKDILLDDYPRLSLDSKFKFSCHKGLPCFNTCCRDVNIFLTPYDVLRMKNALDISSGEFLGKYTIPLTLKEQKLRVVVLKMRDDEDKTCPFVTPEGCKIYQDRPWPCRIYPVGMASQITQKGDENFYFIADTKFDCSGFNEDREWTVEEWLSDQGADIYNKRSQAYKEITLHKLFQQGKGIGPSKLQMFYMACYDLDRFRKQLFESNFFNLFDIEEETIKKMETDDEELLDFSARWLRFSLFGENTVKVKDEVLARKKKELDGIRGIT